MEKSVMPDSTQISVAILSSSSLLFWSCVAAVLVGLFKWSVGSFATALVVGLILSVGWFVFYCLASCFENAFAIAKKKWFV